MALELHIIAWDSEALQPPDEIAIRAPVAQSSMTLQDRFGLCQGRTFCFDINGQVFSGGVYAGVAQPVGNGGDINSRAQQVYGGTVA